MNEKELKLREDENFYDNSYTQSTINNVREDLQNVETFLDLSTDDPSLKAKISQKFEDSLDLIEKRIDSLIVVKVI